MVSRARHHCRHRRLLKARRTVHAPRDVISQLWNRTLCSAPHLSHTYRMRFIRLQATRQRSIHRRASHWLSGWRVLRLLPIRGTLRKSDCRHILAPHFCLHTRRLHSYTCLKFVHSFNGTLPSLSIATQNAFIPAGRCFNFESKSYSSMRSLALKYLAASFAFLYVENAPIIV